MLSTLINVATGSGLKIFGYVLGRLIDGFFRNQEIALAKGDKDVQHMVSLQSGSDTLDGATRATRRIVTYMFVFTCCFVLARAALDIDWSAEYLEARDRAGFIGWIWGGGTNTKISTAAQVILLSWNLLEIMFGFYFTKLGQKS